MSSRRWWRRASLGVVVCGVGFWARSAEPAGDPAQAIKEGMAQYEKGHPAEAIQSLQKAIELIQQRQQAGVEMCLPKALPGWQAGELERDQFAGGTGEVQTTFFKISRTFTRAADEATLTVSLLNSPQYILPQREMLKALKGNALMVQAMNQDGNTKLSFIERDGWSGWQKLDKGTPEGELVLLAEGWMLEIRASVADAAVVEKALGGVDLKGIAGAAK